MAGIALWLAALAVLALSALPRDAQAAAAGQSSADTVSRPETTPQQATFLGTFTQKSDESNVGAVKLNYFLTTEQGKRYAVDFSDPAARLAGPAGGAKPTAADLRGANGAQVEIRGTLEGKTLTARSMRIITPAPIGGVSGAHSVWTKFKDFLYTWTPIIFMGLLVLLIFWGLRSMPRTKPERIKPQSSSAIKWDDVAGCEEAKHELREVVEFLRDPDRFKKLGASVPKGMLLHGPPGTGKTLLAKAVAAESGANFFSQSASSFVEMFAGLGAARVRRLFAVARKNAPAILFIDELDAIGQKRGFDMSREKDQTLNQLLVEMDGFEERGQLIVIGASNRVESLDPALMRPGRFDRQILVGAPDLHGRVQILGVHTRHKPVHGVDMKLVAQQTSGLTGADLANICNEAAIFAGRAERDEILQKDFDGALERVIAGLQTRRVINPRERKIVAYHEAGHALIGELLRTDMKLHKISIVPRGQALGYVLNLPEEDRYLMSKEELMDHMKAMFGGYVAEQLVFGRVTTGPSDDLKRIVELSRSMIEDYGMGTQLIANVNGANKELSEEARRVRDREQQALIDEAQWSARLLITEYRDVLEAIAEKLLEKETLTGDEMNKIIEEALRLSGKQFPTPDAAATEQPSDQPKTHSGRFERNGGEVVQLNTESDDSLPPEPADS
jgi:cell division protease FtsH